MQVTHDDDMTNTTTPTTIPAEKLETGHLVRLHLPHGPEVRLVARASVVNGAEVVVTFSTGASWAFNLDTEVEIMNMKTNTAAETSLYLRAEDLAVALDAGGRTFYRDGAEITGYTVCSFTGVYSFSIAGAQIHFLGREGINVVAIAS